MRDFPTQVGPAGEPVSDSASFTSSNANDVIKEVQGSITSSGQTLIPVIDPANNTQLSEAIALYGAGGASYGVDSGAANAYVITITGSFQPPSAYFDGMIIAFKAANANTIASTVNAFAIGVKDLTLEGGAALGPGVIDTVIENQARYNLSDDRFEILRAAGVGQIDNFSSGLIHVHDEKTSGTVGGAGSGATFNTRTLNTVLTNEISGASLSSNQITLPAGDYYIEASAPSSQSGAVAVSSHKTRLRDITGSATLAVGTNAIVNAESGVSMSSVSFTRGRFTLSVSSVLELQHWIGATAGVTDFGNAVTSGEVEVYAEVRIWKV